MHRTLEEVDVQGYLNHAADFTSEEQALRNEFALWLPKEIIDAHAHCGRPEHVLAIPERAYNHMLSTFPYFTLEQSKKWHELLHPGINFRSLRFAKTFRGIAHKLVNEYLLSDSPEQDRIAVYGLPDEPGYTIAMLQHERTSALKMYYSYLEPPATEIFQYFPDPVLEIAQQKGIPIILHPPAKITKCLGQLELLFAKFPRLKVCIAHLGLTKFPIPGLAEAYRLVARFPGAVMDTSMVPSAEVVAMALKILGPSRILYGSDEPLNLIRASSYEHPKLGQRLMADHPYHWLDRTEQAEHRSKVESITLAHWQCLQALRTAIERLPAEQQSAAKQAVFHDNAARFFGF